MKKNCILLLYSFLLLPFIACEKDPAIIPPAKHLKVEVFIKNLQVPWGMAFLPNGDFIFCQRDGQIDLLKNQAADYNLIMFRTVQTSEGGLLGLAIDPDFINNHDGGALKFGPDGYLYLGTGDAQVPALAQDTTSLAGKILRIDRDGNAAPGNPFNSRIWTYGHRNVQGFDWNKQGKMIATEHGPSGELGWCCHDEINLILPGKNYGWPIAIGGTETDSLTPAIYQTGFEVWAPSGCTFIKGKEWGAWEGDFIFCALRGQRLVRFDMNATGDNVLNRQDTLVGNFQRLRNIIQAPDGSLLFSSSNIGTASPPPLVGDDKIYRISFQ
ncbi:MAG: hypothetical protein A3F72_04095 [Bacteroidetes bacterium RIFCSPLOWO2_12_FULL_35_15]|nr:MAG: hypothetical protein A3F72_04095 [Bacteroidetes bacterium RIFCSPLOWO2_12_FULL_35_15]